MARYAKITIAFGRRGVGKSIETIDTIYDYVLNSPKRKALIFDVNDEFGKFTYKDGRVHEIKAIYIRDIPKFGAQKFPEIRRIRPYWDNNIPMTPADMNEVLYIIFSNYRDGLLLAEDITLYTADNMKRDLVGTMATIRQKGIDLILHYQMIKKAGNPTLLALANFFRIHKTQDTVARHAEKFDDKAEMMMIAQDIVNTRYKWAINQEPKIKTNYGMFFSVFVDVDEMKIKGQFSGKEANHAVLRYINTEPKILMNALKERDIYGNKKYTDRQDALRKLSKELMEEYFVFDKE